MAQRYVGILLEGTASEKLLAIYMFIWAVKKRKKGCLRHMVGVDGKLFAGDLRVGGRKQKRDE